MLHLKNFINYLQSLDESSKKLWVFILSGISMMFIISIWAVYLNATLKGVEPSAIAEKQQEEKEAENKSALFANFKNNTRAISKNTSAFFNRLFNKQNEIIIE